jgi:glycosyltransferase involved in cell wall biosynthesis
MGTLWGTDARASRRARVLTRDAARRAAAVWANTEEQLAVLAGWGVPRSKLHLLRTPGIDVDFWRAEDEPEADLVVGVGNDRHRDHALLVDAVSRLRRRRPVRLELVTALPVEVPHELGRRVESLSHPDLRSLYSRASVVAVALKPNIHVSGATVILEAMACERPVAATGTPGVAAYVGDGETGSIVPAGDPDALAAALEELLSDPDRGRAYGSAGRRRAEASFSSRLTAARLADILHGL